MRAQIGGVERYALEMASRLPALRPERYRVIAPRPRLAHRLGHAWEQAALPVLARGELIYSPANLAPVAAPGAVVIHDLAPLRMPHAFSPVYVAYQRALLRPIVRRAQLLITVSEFSRRELVELLDVDGERVVVAGGGAGERYRPDADAAAACAHLRLEGPYIVAVGTRSARKGFDVLGPVARSLAAEGIALVHAGSGRGYLRDLPTASVLSAGLREIGYVPESLMPGLLAGARALVMPSRYEGFGLPCIEAMACGTPVVAARAGALPEVCSDAALLAEPDDAAGFAEALLAAAGDGTARDGLVARGLARAAELTWERTARLTDAALAPLLGPENAPL